MDVIWNQENRMNNRTRSDSKDSYSPSTNTWQAEWQTQLAVPPPTHKSTHKWRQLHWCSPDIYSSLNLQQKVSLARTMALKKGA